MAMNDWTDGLNFLSGQLNNFTNFASATLAENRAYNNQRKINEQMAVLNRENWEFQNNLAQENWRMVNNYNSPYNVASRYRAAGINPVSALGSGSSGAGVSGDVASSSATTGSGGSVASHVPFLQNAMATLDQHEIAQSQVRLNDALAGKAAGDTKDPDETQRGQMLSNDLLAQNVIGQKTANALSDLDLTFQREVFDTNVSITKEQYENLKKRTAKLNSDLENDITNRKLTEKQIEQISNQIWYNKQSIAIAWARQRDEHALSEQQVKKLTEETYNLQDSRQLIWQEYSKNSQELRMLAHAADISDADFDRIVKWCEPEGDEDGHYEYKGYEKLRLRLGGASEGAARLFVMLASRGKAK